MASKRAEFPVITGAFDRGELAIDQVSGPSIPTNLSGVGESGAYCS